MCPCLKQVSIHPPWVNASSPVCVRRASHTAGRPRAWEPLRPPSLWQLWHENHNECHIPTEVCWTMRLPYGPYTFKVHQKPIKYAIAAAFFPELPRDHFRVKVDSVDKIADAEINVHFRARAPDANAPSRTWPNFELADPVLAHLANYTATINPRLVSQGLQKALNVTGGRVCGYVQPPAEEPTTTGPAERPTTTSPPEELTTTPAPS